MIAYRYRVCAETPASEEALYSMQSVSDVLIPPPSPSSVTLLKPPLKWAGGKRWLVPHLLPFWREHAHRRLVEPFVGGMAVTLGLLPDKALLNDINPHLISFYCRLQSGLRFDIEMRNDEALYYRQRDRFNALITGGKRDSAEAAQLFWYLNRTCYNGLCRFNQRGTFNVPFGRYKSINHAPDFSLYPALLARWSFSCTPFTQVVLDAEDFVYADPPYDVEFRQYSSERFNWTEQVQLAEWLSHHPGPVMLSNQATPRIIELYDRLGYDTTLRLQAPRMINCTGDRTRAEEVVATRNLPKPSAISPLS